MLAKSNAEESRIDTAKADCNTARDEAIKSEAEKFAPDELNRANEELKCVSNLYSYCEVNSSQYVGELNRVAELYKNAKTVAMAAKVNRPEVYVRAMLNGSEVKFPITKGVMDVNCKTPKVVRFRKDQVGSFITFQAEGEIDDIVYAGEVNYMVQRGSKHNVTIYLAPKYTLDSKVVYCPYCEPEYRLMSRHLIRCPRCKRSLMQYMKYDF